MTPLQITIENYYRTYLETVQTGDQELPSTADLPRICAHDHVEMQLPMISVSADEPDDAGMKSMVPVNVIVRVCIQARLEDGSIAPGGTAYEDALEWVKAVQLRLQDDEAFRAHILALPEADRTGSEMVTRDPSSRVNYIIVPADNVEMWELNIEHWVNLDPD